MSDPAAILAREGIRCASTLGDHHATCPRCSHLRRKKTQRCLSVTVTTEAVLWRCWHCDYRGGLNLDDTQSRSPALAHRGAAHRSERRPTHGDLLRRAASGWVHRP